MARVNTETLSEESEPRVLGAIVQRTARALTTPVSTSSVTTASYDVDVLFPGVMTNNRWTEQKRLAIEFARKQSLSVISGSYIISCDALSADQPMTLDITYTTENNPRYEVFEAAFNFRRFKGTIIMAQDRDRLASYCWSQTEVNRPEHLRSLEHDDSETMRLRHLNSIAADKFELQGKIAKLDAGNQSASATQLKYPSPPSSLHFEYRCRDFAKSLNRLETDAHTGQIWFMDPLCLRPEGCINFPAEGDKPLSFRGYKVSAAPQTPFKPWASYETRKVRFGSAS